VSSDPFVSYAQNHEDVVLARALRPDSSTGFWIDVGAGDPIDDSVTAAFAERGWRGINIEPLRDEHERLCEARPRDTNLRVALGKKTGHATLFEGPPENRGASTLVPMLVQRYEKLGKTFEPVEVVMTTLARVVAEHVHDRVDFLKIDVEGSERAVLEGADWSCFHPRVIVIEATEPNSTRSTHDDWESLLLEQGYRFAMFDGLNRFYASATEPLLAEALATPANVLDDFIPYRWEHQVRGVTATARRESDRADMALEQTFRLRDDLDAAQRITAQALDLLEEAQRDAAAAREAVGELEELRRAHDALLDTKLYRYTAPFRRLYGRLTRRLRRRAT
jgi:FkbM family methyltransferase